ncbi:GspH/FimT family pseudopilin [Georgfuchsia toluolica]|uniref:GspH/FimT family pseudopilin n=1 Tax=Georgfuchsia toluolica TaxID=424218 RepID=UPI00248485F4|nr:GspH/FimT family pseudopilin [Georgfuchsia toluolica]
MRTRGTRSRSRVCATAASIRGFTLIELMIAIAVLGIALGIALPSYRDFVAASRVRTATFDLMAMLTLTRSEAIKRNNAVALELGAGGWSVAAPNIASGTVILRREAFNGVTLACKTGPGCPAAGVQWPTGGVIYTGNGRLAITPSPTIDLGGTETGIKRCISIDLSGQPRSAATVCP